MKFALSFWNLRQLTPAENRVVEKFAVRRERAKGRGGGVRDDVLDEDHCVRDNESEEKIAGEDRNFSAEKSPSEQQQGEVYQQAAGGVEDKSRAHRICTKICGGEPA